MRRRGTIVALGAMLGMLGGALTVSPAQAGRGPNWEYLPAEPFTVSASECGFGIQVTAVSKEYIKELKTPDGSVLLFTGSFVQSYANLSTGKTITENASASARITVNADGSATVVSTGLSPLFLAPAEAQQLGLPAVNVLAGVATFSLDPDGNVTALSLQGHVQVDVCAALS